MDERQVIDAANHITIQRLLMRHLSCRERYTTRVIAGATVIVEPSRHRTGVPLDVECRRYVFTNINEGWSMAVRAAWRADRLYEPAAVHCRIEVLWDDDGRYGDDESAVASAVNRWLHGALQ